jgi:hypothetical protein
MAKSTIFGVAWTFRTLRRSVSGVLAREAVTVSTCLFAMTPASAP